VAGKDVASGAVDARLFTPWGVLSTTGLGYAGGGPNGGNGQNAVRLDSTYVYSDPDNLRRYRVGDFITGGLSWTRPVRFGGVQINTDFTLRPDLITFPLPTIGGSVAVPSTVSVLTNGNTLFSRQVGAGPFEIPQLPVVTGANTISLNVTNALGRQVTINVPFYASATLLAEGLQSYSMQAGAVRRDWGVFSNHYDNWAASGTYRRGVLPWLTLEASSEATPGTVMAGGGAVVNLANWAVLNLSASASQGFGGLSGFENAGGLPAGRGIRVGTGTQYSIGVQRLGRVLSLGASATMASRSYRDIAAVNGSPSPKLQLTGSAGLSLGKFGSVGIAYAELDLNAVPSPVQIYLPVGTELPSNATQTSGAVFLQPAQRSRVLSASYSLQVGGVSFYATAFKDFAQRSSSGALVGMSIPLGGRSSMSASLGAGSSGRYGELQAQQSATRIGEFGFQASGTAGIPPEHEFGQGQYMSPWGLLTLGADQLGRRTTGRAEVQGAVSTLDGRVFASNTINDSFAVVDTNGLGGVRVLSENRLVGRTDPDGRLLVPDLRSFDVNHISIDPADVPADSAVDTVARTVRPQDRSGVVVRFGVRVSHGALLRMVDGAGAVIPVGSTAMLRTTKVLVPVGYDGEAYLEGLAAHNDVDVVLPNGKQCNVAFDFKAVAGTIPAIGPLKCQ
jgi:outer membrane usher protein